MGKKGFDCNKVEGTTVLSERSESNGFTFIELIVVIAILAIFSAFIMGNFMNTIKKGRDARRKIDLEQIQKGLEMYYEDKQTYPLTISFGGNNQIIDSVSGKIYMQKIPNDPVSSNRYRYCTDVANPNKYQLYAKLENLQDTGIITPVPLGFCTNDCSGGCNYGITSSNTTP